MDNGTPKITIFDCENNSVQERDMTDEEITNLPQSDNDPLAQ